MKLGIIGPTQWQRNCKIIGVSEKEFLGEIKKIAETVFSLGFEITINPHKNGASFEFALEFKRLGGKVFGIVPLQDKEFGIDYLDQSVCDEIIDCGTWRNQPESLNENCEAMLCLGFSSGTINEVAFSKWFPVGQKSKKVLVVKEFISKELPSESVKDINLEYILLGQLEKKLKELK